MWQGIATAGQHHKITNIVTLLGDAGWSHHYPCLWSPEALQKPPVQQGWCSHQRLSYHEQQQQVAWHRSGLYHLALLNLLLITQCKGTLCVLCPPAPLSSCFCLIFLLFHHHILHSLYLQLLLLLVRCMLYPSLAIVCLIFSFIFFIISSLASIFSFFLCFLYTKKR